jgi:hypothetical protein
LHLLFICRPGTSISRHRIRAQCSSDYNIIVVRTVVNMYAVTRIQLRMKYNYNFPRPLLANTPVRGSVHRYFLRSSQCSKRNAGRLLEKIYFVSFQF